VFFVDSQYQGAVTALGNSGGGLMYNALPFAVLGIGFDEFGNFSTGLGGAGGPGFSPNNLVVRSTQASGYSYLAGANVTPGTIQGANAAAFRNVSITVDSKFVLNVTVDFDDGRGAVPVISNLQLAAANFPNQIKFGFGASTGGATNFHQLDTVQVIAGADAVGNFEAAGKNVSVNDSINPNADRMLLPLPNLTRSGLLLNLEKIDTAANADLAIDRISFAMNYLQQGMSDISSRGALFDQAAFDNQVAADRYEEASVRMAAADIPTAATKFVTDQIAMKAGIGALSQANAETADQIRKLYNQIA
jgi:flagellin-like hook-associated protein FlgL